FLAETGGIPQQEVRRAFNLGLGMTMVIAEGDADAAIEALGERGLAAFHIGSIHRGDGGVVREASAT
ncbi:MAG: phosphoribosylformylglycinamidine cyclo-ligase, partial [Actinomycetota bacterium]